MHAIYQHRLSFRIIHVFYAFRKSFKLTIFVIVRLNENVEGIQSYVRVKLISLVIQVSNVINHVIIDSWNQFLHGFKFEAARMKKHF